MTSVAAMICCNTCCQFIVHSLHCGYFGAQLVIPPDSPDKHTIGGQIAPTGRNRCHEPAQAARHMSLMPGKGSVKRAGQSDRIRECTRLGCGSFRDSYPRPYFPLLLLRCPEARATLRRLAAGAARCGLAGERVTQREGGRRRRVRRTRLTRCRTAMAPS